MAAITPVNVTALREKSTPQAARADALRFAETLDEAQSTQTSGGLVPAVRTQLSAPQAQEALRAAWEQVTGSAPSDKTLALVTAQWAHETGHGASMYNYNFAGIKGTGPSGLSVAQRTREGYGASEQRIVDNFRAYRSAEEGAVDYVQLLTRRFPEAVEGARQGDPAAFVRGLKSRGYFTGHEGSYLSSVTAIASRYLGEALETPGAAPPVLDYGSVREPASALDLRALHAQMLPATDYYVDALGITDQIDRAALRAFSGAREEG